MATLQEMLAEAQSAYHDLSIGKAVVETHDANGEMVRYFPATRSQLRAYIEDLKQQIAGRGSGPMWLVL